MTDLLTLGRKYKLILLDPAWEYEGDPDKPQAAGKHYNTMSLDELKDLPVRGLIEDPGVIFVWATGPKLDQAVDLIRSWDFYYRGIAYVWVKTTQGGKVINGQGIRPSFVKSTTELVLVGSTDPPDVELVLVGSTGKSGRTIPLKTESQGQVVFAPRGEHSEKPDEVRWRIEELFGDIPRLEMFARCKFSGWDAWGLEANGPMQAVDAQSPKLREALLRRADLEAQRALTASIGDLPED